MNEAKVIKGNYVLQTANPGQYQAIFPNAKVATIRGHMWVAVPYDLDSARVLTNMGVKVQSPIRTEYDWPGRFTPYDHQYKTAEFFTMHNRSHCLNGMGSMKTISSLWAADYMKRQGKIDKTLIIAPLSTLDPTWADEIFKNFPLRTFAILHGTRDRRRALLALPHDFYIVNHDGVALLQEELMEREDINHFIVDEQAVYRNSRTKRWKTMNTILNKCGFARSAWGLTGAPTPNEPTDAFGQTKLLTPENYKGTFTSFKNETMQQITQYKWVPRKGSEDTINRVLKPSIRYALRDCVDLPPTIFSERHVDMSPEQQKHYKELLQQAVTEVRGSQVTAVNAAVLIGKIIQAVSGVLYGSDGELLKIDFSPRIKIVREIIESCQQKVIVFVPLTGALNAVAADLRKNWSVEIIDGSTSVSKRNRIFQEFRQTKDPHVLVANAGAMSHGLTLTEASTIIWYAPTNSNDTYNQANARIVRPGQKHPTNIVHLYSTPEERKIYTALKEKTRLQDIVLELAKGG